MITISLWLTKKIPLRRPFCIDSVDSYGTICSLLLHCSIDQLLFHIFALIVSHALRSAGIDAYWHGHWRHSPIAMILLVLSALHILSDPNSGQPSSSLYPLYISAIVTHWSRSSGIWSPSWSDIFLSLSHRAMPGSLLLHRSPIKSLLVSFWSVLIVKGQLSSWHEPRKWSR